MPKMTPWQSFEGLVDERGPDDCWPWLGSLTTHGAKFLLHGGKIVDALRYMTQCPPKLVVWNICGHSVCCNPDHLRVGTKKERRDTGGCGTWIKTIPIPEMTSGLIAKFWSRVDIQGPDDCWPWQLKCGGTYSTYGNFNVTRSQSVRTNRMAYYLTHGVDPGELRVCHSCDNPPCCNPAHLWLGTTLDNSRDMVAKGRGVQPKYGPRISKLPKTPRVRVYQFTRAQVREIREIVAQGPRGTASRVAEIYGTDPGTISQIVNRKVRWETYG